MMRILVTSAVLLLAAVAAPAQMPGSAAKAAAQKAAAATSAQIGAEQAPTTEQFAPANAAPAPATTQAAPTKTQAPPTKPAPKKSAAQKTEAGKKGVAPTTPASDTAGPPPTIWRESFQYSADRRRDPFNSLLTTNELRPTLSDLKITGILFDPSGRRSFATLRDLVTNAQYRVTNGSTLGRMRVTGIRTKLVVFTIDEFGTTRQDSLVFGDTTKARAK
ncbi:MAG: hypothetical protein ABI442_03390 [Gemmatimonadaceae bacterium]